MKKISFHIQTSKEGQVKVRYRLRDGRDIQLTHKTSIRCNTADLDKLNPDGSTKDKVRVYNVELSEQLMEEYRLMVQAYELMHENGMDMTSEVFEQEIDTLRNPISSIRKEKLSIVSRFRKYADDALRANILGPNRHKHIIVVSEKLQRYLTINGLSGMTAEEFDIENLMGFREFLFDEYLYVKKYDRLYKGIKQQNRPKARLSINTVSSQLKMLQAFFSELESYDEIRKSPFRKLSKDRKKVVMKTKYDDPIYLRKEELQKVIKAKVSAQLQDVKDAFIVQCAFGCRISDFQDMTMDSISVSEDGIPYIHYIPKKTVDAQDGNTEILTPIVRYAFDIIKKTNFEFPILRNIYGTHGYNACIRALLQHCKIDRLIPKFNEQNKKNDYIPLFKAGSSKIARKTHVDIMNKVQIDMYAAGLHKVGSKAVNRYTSLEIKDQFKLMNAAFGQKPYFVDNLLNIVK